jgi:MgtC family
MRLPLGILTGVGFIGGGTILKRGDLVTGVTTAATLWLVTVIGLCFGGGQLALRPYWPYSRFGPSKWSISGCRENIVPAWS